ncbi:hypothetical protein FRC18_008651 [Serendipita sp. 400]|nr:hypothetical protein FRC18_008651 [Serendipita sp. 400]
MEAQNSSEQSLEHHFNDLCGDYFGAVAVRQSHGIFSRLMSALPVLHGPSATLMQRHDALNPNSKLKHTAAHESTSMSGKVQDMSRPEHRLLHSDKTIEEFFKLSLKDSDTNSAEQSDKLTFGRRRLRGSPGERKGQGRDEEPRGFVLETLPPEWATLQATRPNVHQDTATTALSMEERSTTRAQLSTPGPSTTDSPQSPSHDHLGNVTALHTIVPSPSAASTDTVPLVNEDSSGTRLRHPIPDTLEISQAELVWLNGNPTIVQWKAGGASTFKVIYSCKICRWPELAFETILKHVLDIHYLAPTQSQVGCSCGVLFADTQTLEQHRNHDHYADQELKIIDKSGLRGLITNKAQMIEKLEPPLENLLMYHSGNSNAAKARMLNWIALQRSDSFPGLLCRRSRNQTRNRRLLRLNRSLIMVCCPCGAPRFDMRQMAIHLLETHIREPGFCCKLCSSAFNAKANLIRHVLRFHPNSPNEQIGGEPEKDDEESVMDMDDLEADPDHEKQIRLEEQYIERVFEAFNCPD